MASTAAASGGRGQARMRGHPEPGTRIHQAIAADDLSPPEPRPRGRYKRHAPTRIVVPGPRRARNHWTSGRPNSIDPLSKGEAWHGDVWPGGSSRSITGDADVQEVCHDVRGRSIRHDFADPPGVRIGNRRQSRERPGSTRRQGWTLCGSSSRQASSQRKHDAPRRHRRRTRWLDFLARPLPLVQVGISN